MNSFTDWQTWAALAIVIVTALIFAVRSAKKKSSGGCGSCGCGHAQEKKHVIGKTEHRH